jgi:pimeloyl-ACP methyl ester carboxylesterase
MANVRKGCVQTPHGEVHFRHGGSGPVVVLLNDSPRSSVQHVPNIEWLGEHFTVLALDTPGCGLSSPLSADEPAIPDYSSALAGTLTALGIERCALYGFHTGSMIALQFAADHPLRAALTILDGLSLPERPADDAFRRASLTPFAPTPEGDYIARQWSRLLDSHRYFPWFALTANGRLPTDLPDDLRLHECATDLFMAGPHGTRLSSAALRYEPGPVMARLTSPVVFMGREGDVLYGHLDRLPAPLPSGSRIARVPDAPGAWRSRMLSLLREARGLAPAWAPPARRSATGGSAQRHCYVEMLHGQVRVGLQGAASARPPLLMLHDLPGTPRQLDRLATVLSQDRLTVTPELPGLGESDPLASPTLGAYVAIFDELLDALGLESVDVLAEGMGTVFAAALAANRPKRVRRLAFDGVSAIRIRDRKRFVREYCPRLVPERSGAHLIRLWEQLRTAQMSWPWFDRTAAAVRRRTPDLDADVMHAALVDAMKQPGSYGDAARAALDAAMRDIARSVAQPVLVMQDEQDVRYGGTGSLRRRLQRGVVQARPESLAERAALYRAFFD